MKDAFRIAVIALASIYGVALFYFGAAFNSKNEFIKQLMGLDGVAIQGIILSLGVAVSVQVHQGLKVFDVPNNAKLIIIAASARKRVRNTCIYLLCSFLILIIAGLIFSVSPSSELSYFLIWLSLMCLSVSGICLVDLCLSVLNLPPS